MIPEFLKKRHKVTTDYCLKKGWTTKLGELSIEQIMEIKELEEWKKAGVEN